MGNFTLAITLSLVLCCANNGVAQTTSSYDLLEPPVFSIASGFYSEPFLLTLSHPDHEASIYYTLDGSQPDPNNLSGTTYHYKTQYAELPENAPGELLEQTYKTFSYNQPIAISNRTPETNLYGGISTTYNYTPYFMPSFPLFKGTVVRAIAVNYGFSSEVKTCNYFVTGSDFNQPALPVIALTVDPSEFFGYENGIDVAGKDFDDWRIANPATIADGSAAANYNRSGSAWEIKAHLNYLLNDLEALNQDVGIRIHGAQSRILPNKSLRVYAKSAYGNSELNTSFFPDNTYSSFKRVILRNSGGDSYLTMIRDGFIQRAVKHLSFQTQACQPSVLFLNSEYWGIFNIRERYDDKYFERVFNIDTDDLDYLEADGFDIEYGENTHYRWMVDFIGNNSLTSQENYDYVTTMMDVDNYIDFYIANIYIANTDWPHNNIEFWRKRTAYDPTAPYGLDGRWRWVLKDTDFGFGGSDLADPVHHNTLSYAAAPLGFGGAEWPNFLFRQLLLNETFRNKFINRFADMLNTTFIPERIISILYEARDEITSEIQNHISRWNHIGSFENWNQNINTIVNFAQERPAIQQMHIRDQFALEANTAINLNVNDASKGYIKLNTIDIKEGTPGVSANPYPWNGTYFKGIPVHFKAVPAEGYTFSHWSGDWQGTDPEVTLSPVGDMALTANFTSSLATQKNERPSIFSLYPNPFTGVVQIKTDLLRGVYSVFSVDGKLLREEVLTSEIDLSNLASGVYLIRVSGDGNSETKKLIKK